MKPYAYLIFGVIGFACLTIWLRTRLRYRLDGPVLRILLFGLPLRKIHVSTIARIGKRPTLWTENWGNVWHAAHRELVLHRKGALRRPVLITPPNRYVVMASIQKAMDALRGSGAEQTQLVADDEPEG